MKQRGSYITIQFRHDPSEIYTKISIELLENLGVQIIGPKIHLGTIMYKVAKSVLLWGSQEMLWFKVH